MSGSPGAVAPEASSGRSSRRRLPAAGPQQEAGGEVEGADDRDDAEPRHGPRQGAAVGGGRASVAVT
jgi:hypothetical protein